MDGSISQRKLEANRRIAQKSTGPRTSAGKSLARLNAVTHGILAKEVVVKSGDGAENAAEFAALVESLHAQLQPRDAIEHVLVDRVAACYWRLRRAQRYEVGAVREGLDNCKTPLDEPGPNMKKHNAKVRQYEMMLDIERHLEQKFPQSRQSSGAPGTEAAAGSAADQSAHRPDSAFGPHADNPASPASEDRLAMAEAVIREYASLDQIAKIQDAQADSRRPLLAALPNDEQLDRLIRYETMLDRQLHRALSELRRRRQWNDSLPSDMPNDTHPKEP